MNTKHLLVCAALACVAVTAPALAQFGPPGGGGDRPAGRRGGGFMRGAGDLGEIMQPEFSPRDMPLFQEGLELDAGQEAVVRVLLEDYGNAFQTALEPVNENMQEILPQIMRSFMSPETRERFRGAMERAQGEIERALEARGEVSDEERQAIIEERMIRTFEQVRAEREASGEEAATRALMGTMIDSFDALRARRAELREKLIADLRVQLAPEQMELWPSFERRLDREKSLPRGRLSGESTDLIRVVDRLEMPESMSDADWTALDSVLEAYEIRLAEALRARNDFLAQSEPRVLRSMQEMDMETGLDLSKKQVQYRIRVRDVNEEFRTAIFGALPTEVRPAFAREALAASFDRVYRPTRADQVLEYVRSLDLGSDLVAQVDAIEEAYRLDLASMNERIVALMKREEPKEQVRQAERMVGFMTGNLRGLGFGRDENDPVREAFRQRRDAVEKHIERLAALLTPEQAAGLPSEERRGMGGGFDNLPEEMRTRMLERFDTNGNGRIDPDEQEAATRFFRERFRGDAPME